MEQAMNAAKRAHAAGVRRQRMELLLPLIGATDLDDWPGGIRQQFKVLLWSSTLSYKCRQLATVHTMSTNAS